MNGCYGAARKRHPLQPVGLPLQIRARDVINDKICGAVNDSRDNHPVRAVRIAVILKDSVSTASLLKVRLAHRRVGGEGCAVLRNGWPADARSRGRRQELVRAVIRNRDLVRDYLGLP